MMLKSLQMVQNWMVKQDVPFVSLKAGKLLNRAEKNTPSAKILFERDWLEGTRRGSQAITEPGKTNTLPVKWRYRRLSSEVEPPRRRTESLPTSVERKWTLLIIYYLIYFVVHPVFDVSGYSKCHTLRTDGTKIEGTAYLHGSNISLKDRYCEKQKYEVNWMYPFECGLRKFHHRPYVADITYPRILGLDFLANLTYSRPGEERDTDRRRRNSSVFTV
ncbi:hypothetical protein AVEN_71409-1 [Araneus ventricosus]|uniref:Uncharacterized protein n=1 Tax=Araneus ventricosus TaxID=182803 RepID=A0A4Y2BKS9_ARAVE|nr:hypothetical protein AVEN_71409-1 [Araneus ventricosus]